MQPSLEKFSSMPNVRKGSSTISYNADKKMNSLSLSHIKRHAGSSLDYHHKPSPFYLRWINGHNAKVGIINLNDKGTTTVFYAVCNCSVLYNWTTNHMRILQGHRHTVTSIASDSSGKWLVTADSGPENIIIIWDSGDYFPHRTLFAPHGRTDVSKVAISADAKFLLSLGYQDKAIIHWWIWSFGLNTPHAILDVDIRKDGIIAMEFNPFNSEQFVLMTRCDIWIGISGKIFVMERGLLKETDAYQLKIRKPEKNITLDYGRLTSLTFVQNTSQILVGSSKGAVLIYGYTLEYKNNISTTDYEQIRFVKVLKMEKYQINTIKSIDGVVVTGNNNGDIHFYDDQLKLLYWIHGFKLDSVKSISFNISPRSYQIIDAKCGKRCYCWEKVVTKVDEKTGQVRQKLMKSELPTDATTGRKPFVLRDFTVFSMRQGLSFVDFVTEKLTTILDFNNARASAITVHPEKPYVCIGYENGVIELYNFVQHKLFVRLDLKDFYKVVIPSNPDSIKNTTEIIMPEMYTTCLKYSPSGLFIACGLNTGEMIFLDPTTIEIRCSKPHKDTEYAIKLMDYSPDSLTLATADTGKTICVFKYYCDIDEWVFVGKHRSHYKDITAVLFLPEKNEDNEYKLISLGSDRVMVEYDIGASSDEFLEITSLDRVDQASEPLTAIPWPTPKYIDPETCRSDLPMILIANDEYKYKIVNHATTMTLSTILGPRFEDPVCRMQLISRQEDNEELQYILFATKNVIGLQKLPLDGNPWKHIGLLGHPKQVIGMCFREDLGLLFTIGAKDSSMCQWVANYRSVEATKQLGGQDLDPYYCLIENGRPGWLFQEIRDLFYYIQILCQGTFSPATRRVKDYIPIDSLPDLMRALGFFPSEYEVENFIVEAKFKVYQKRSNTEIDFEEFVKLYLNHRPAFSDNIRKIRNAFGTFASGVKDNYMMNRNDFVDILSNYGECFPRELSWYLLSILSGHSFEDRSALVPEDFSFLPEDITFSDLVSSILGIPDIDNTSEQYSGTDTNTSQAGSSDTEDKD